jgi:hypothetical protein
MKRKIMEIEPTLPRWKRVCWRIGLTFVFLSLVAATIWCCAALYFDFNFPSLRIPAAAFYVICALSACCVAKTPASRAAILAGGFAVVLVWWLSLKPSNDRAWQSDVSQMPWAEIHDDQVSIHNFRHCEYRSEFEYTCSWTTKEVKLSDVRGIDFFITYWGSPWIAHTILSFQIGDDDHLAMSIETRKVVGQQYSAIQGFFRRYTLIYVIADERDLIKLRTNYRKGEDVYMYRTKADPAFARALFVEYLRRADELRQRPQWYNALTNNCTTVIFKQMTELTLGAPPKWDWRYLLNGHSDQMEYEKGNLAGNLPFAELKKAAHINLSARAAGDAPDFSKRIRQGRPGFDTPH